MTKQSTTRTARNAADQALIDGINAVLATTVSLSVGGQAMTPKDIVQLLKARIDAGKAVEPAKAAFLAASKADKDERAKTAATVAAVRRLLVAMFASDHETLAKFGLTAPKVAKRSAATKASSAAKATATRKAHEAAKAAKPAEVTPTKLA